MAAFPLSHKNHAQEGARLIAMRAPARPRFAVQGDSATRDTSPSGRGSLTTAFLIAGAVIVLVLATWSGAEKTPQRDEVGEQTGFSVPAP